MHFDFNGPHGVIGLALFAVPTILAAQRGRDVVTWVIYSLLLWPIAFVHSLIIFFGEWPTGKRPFEDDE